MMGLFGMGDFTKPGSGVRKDVKEKKRFFKFFELYGRKFTNLIKLNLLFLLFCIPIVTIGPATAAMIKITRYYVEEKPVFLFHDFFEAFKENFKQGFVVGIIQFLFSYLFYKGFVYLYIQTYLTSKWLWIIIILEILIAIIFIFIFFYIYLTMVCINLNLIGLFKNAFSLAFLGIRTNFITLFFVLCIIGICLINIFVTLLLLLLIVFSTLSLLITFNSHQYIYKYLMKPYYEQNGLENPYERSSEDAVFEDNTL